MTKVDRFLNVILSHTIPVWKTINTTTLLTSLNKMDTHFETFMRCLYNKKISLYYVSYYLFEFMEESFKRRKYGYEKQALVSFRKLLYLCVALKDFDIVTEIWTNMEETEKMLWQNSPEKIPELLNFIDKTSPIYYQLHKIYTKNETFCCNYCEFLTEIGIVTRFFN